MKTKNARRSGVVMDVVETRCVLLRKRDQGGEIGEIAQQILDDPALFERLVELRRVRRRTRIVRPAPSVHSPEPSRPSLWARLIDLLRWRPVSA